LSVERINSQLNKVREQIAQLQEKEKDLAEQKQMAEDAETMKIIKKWNGCKLKLMVPCFLIIGHFR